MNEKIIWYSNSPWSNSAYGRLTREIVWRLKDNYRFAILNNFGFAGGLLNIDDVQLYPHTEGLDESMFADVYDHFNADLMIICYDLWGLKHLPNVAASNNLMVAGYIPVDHYDGIYLYEKQLRSLVYAITYCDYGKNVLDKEGIKCSRIYPGISDIYKVHEKRKHVLGFSDDDFVITMVQMNRNGRKNIPRQLEGIAHFIHDNPDINAKLYLHMLTQVIDGDDIHTILKLLDIENNTRVINEFTYKIGLSDEEMVKMYNASDVTVYASSSEGFGYPIIESLACGVPCICANNTSMPEIIRSTPELLVECDDTIWMPRVGIRYWLIDKYDLSDKLNYVANHDYNREKLSNDIHKRFNWNVIIPQWIKTLNDIFCYIDEYCLRIPYQK